MAGKRTFQSRTFKPRTFASATWRGVKATRPILPVVDECTAFYSAQRGRGYVGERERGLVAMARKRAFTTGRE